jgi:type II secretory pathway pseudopilin PulG
LKRSDNKARRVQATEGGYILLVLILMVALLAIAAAAIAPSIAFEVKRDREEELIHRGVQYSRAIRHYYKKFNRYPSKIEDLESTNNIRFLRKRYKDPITGNDFKILHLGEIQLALGSAAIGGLAPGGGPGSLSGPGQPGQSTSLFGGGTSSGGLSGNKAETPAKSPDNPDATGNSPGQASQSTPGGSSSSPFSDSSSSPDKLAGQTFGGGPFAGVVSASKAVSIREFNKKNHYNDWLFIYSPQADRGGLLNTPYQPGLQVNAPGVPGTLGTLPTTGSGNSGAGNQASPFGGQQQQAPNVQPQQPAPQ